MKKMMTMKTMMTMMTTKGQDISAGKCTVGSVPVCTKGQDISAGKCTVGSVPLCNRAPLCTGALRFLSILLLILCLGVSEAWGATVTYHIINLGKLDDSGQLTSTRTEALRFTSTETTVGLPDQFKSPLAKNWQYYSSANVTFNEETKVCTFNSGPSLSVDDALSDGDHVYVTYEFNEAALSAVNLIDGGICKIKFDETNQYLKQTVYDNQPNTGSFALQENSTFYWKVNIKDPYQITIQSQSTAYLDYYLSADAGKFGDIRLKNGLGTAKNNKVWAFGLLPGSESTYRLVVTDAYKGTANTNELDEFGHGYLNNRSSKNNEWKTRYQLYKGNKHEQCNLTFDPVDKNIIIVNYSGGTLVQATTKDYSLEVPDVIKSPLASYTYYGAQQDAIDGTNALSGSNVGSLTTIYVRYTTNGGSLDLNGGTDYYIATNNNFLYASSASAIGIENPITSDDNTRKWKITGNDAYQLTLQNADNNNYVTYNVTSGEAVPTLSGTGGKFFLHQSSTGKYELVAATNTDHTEGYYTLGVDGSTLKLYSKANHLLGDDELQTVISTQPVCAKPTITFTNTNGEVTLNSATDGVTIYYTTDGTTPSTSSSNYSTTGAFTISATTTIKAIATKSGWDNSTVAESTFEQLVAPTVTFDDASQSVTVTTNSTVEDVSTVYTDTGTDPTTSSTAYSTAISPTATTTIKAMTVKEGYVNSNVVSLVVTKLALPTITISSNTATLSHADAGATIHYTTDGTTPTQESASYSSALTLDENGKNTIKAFAIKTGCLHSGVAEEVIDNRSTIPAPTITYTGNTVTITASDASDEIYYTTDGTPPTTSTLTKFTGSGSFTLAAGSSYTVTAIAAFNNRTSEQATETVNLMDLGYSGIYYIQNNANSGAYYMYPVGSDVYVKTAKITDKDAIWELEMVGDYYRIIHYESGKYLVAADLVDGSMPETNTVSLVTTDSPGESALFEITRLSGDESNILGQTILIRPKAATNTTNGTHIYLNTTSGNDGTHTIGLYDNTGSSVWKLATVPAKPTFSVSDINVTMSCDLGNIYYTIDGTDPTSASTSGNSVTLAYGPTYTVKAISIYNDTKSGETWQSGVASKSVTVNVMAPAFSVSGNKVKLRSLQDGVSFRYTLDSGVTLNASTGEAYDNSTGITLTNGNIYTVKAIAVNTVGDTPYISSVSTFEVDLRNAIEITSLAGITSTTGNYKIGAGFTATGTPRVGGDGDEIGTESNPFQGTLDGNFVEIKVENSPLFAYVQDATIKNVKITSSSVSTSGNAGAIANVAKGDSRIYNCGVLGGTVSGSTNVGSIVGLLDGTSRVINCYSFATISGGSMMGGIVGRNNQTSTMSTIKTIVVNCMFYGEITGGSPGSAYPVYGGNIINNEDGSAINNYNYYRGEATFDDSYTEIAHYNRSWPAEEQHLTRFEYYRSILNSNRRLCTWWVNGTNNYASTDDDVENVGIAKWVLDPSIAPYPILKPWGKYPSIINPDPNRTWRPKAKDANGIEQDAHWVTRTDASSYEGKKLGTIKITVKTGSHPGTLTGLTVKSVDLNQEVVTDMDTLNCDYGYAKVQLPYYNEVFGDPTSSSHLTRYYGNYTNKVVTAWKITSVTDDGRTRNAFVKNWETGYNYADRNCTAKDIYADNDGRAFAQGGYYYVPEGVTAIEIEAYWGTAFYLHGKEHAVDRVNVTKSKNYGKAFAPAGTLSSTWDYNNITIYDDLATVIGALSNVSTVYDQAIVFVGNYQVQARNDISLNSSSKRVTFMSADLDMDNEPDFCWQLQWRSDLTRLPILPVRFDFLPIPELGLAIRHNTYAYAIGIMVPKGHFEITETSYMHTTQFEYMSTSVSAEQHPLILNGGQFEQIVSHGNKSNPSTQTSTRNIILGGHVWMKRFTPGSHSGQYSKARHCAISVMGGDFPEFYLSGLYWTGATSSVVYDDNPHCYTNGGHFGIMAGAGMEAVKNSVYFEIDHSVIDEFYGGGINANNPVGGSINVTINNSIVNEKYCGGPKVGTSLAVTTKATGTTFNQFFGGGNGGTNLYRENIQDATPNDMPNESTWSGSTYGWSNFTPISGQGDGVTYDADKGYHAEFEFEVFNQSNGISKDAVARTYRHWAQFGVTSTGNVTNTLEDCTFKNNFYGGGNLAGVSGNVTSTLTDCTVTGSAFGAGYSASIPHFPVHDKSQKSFPYRDAAGVCHNGSVEYRKDGDVIRQYTWCYKNPTTNVVSPAGVVIPDGVSTSKPAFQYGGKWYCYTTTSLENLGTVTGNTTLTINGDTKIGTSGTGHDVYGGGDESAVTGNTTVYLEGTAEVFGDVFGGGNHGLVEGSTEVNIAVPGE